MNFCYLLAPLVALLLAAPRLAQAQTGSVGIGTNAPAASAALDITSTSQGLLLPRLSLAQRTALTASASAPPVPGLVIYQTDNTPGLYAYDGAAWVRLGADNLGSHTATQNLNLGANQLVGNGGSTGLAVDAAGNAQLAAANAYTYAAPKAYTITYGAADFDVENGGARSFLDNALLGTHGPGSQSEIVSSSSVRAPLHLPAGARLVSVTLYHVDRYQVDFSVRATTLTAGAYTVAPTVLATVTTAAYPSNNFVRATILTFGSATLIDNAKAYYIRLGSDTASPVQFVGASVTYTISQAE